MPHFSCVVPVACVSVRVTHGFADDHLMDNGCVTLHERTLQDNDRTDFFKEALKGEKVRTVNFVTGLVHAFMLHNVSVQRR